MSRRKPANPPSNQPLNQSHTQSMSTDQFGMFHAIVSSAHQATQQPMGQIMNQPMSLPSINQLIGGNNQQLGHISMLLPANSQLMNQLNHPLINQSNDSLPVIDNDEMKNQPQLPSANEIAISGYRPVSVSEQPFTTHEASTLLALTKLYTREDGSIYWSSVASHWYSQWQQEQALSQSNQLMPRILPRDKKALKSKHDALARAQKLKKQPDSHTVSLDEMVKEPTRWTKSENDLFLRIFDQNPEMSRATFNKLWTAAGAEELSAERYYNKVKTVSRARKTAAARGNQESSSSNKRQKPDK